MSVSKWGIVLFIIALISLATGVFTIMDYSYADSQCSGAEIKFLQVGGGTTSFTQIGQYSSNTRLAQSFQPVENVCISKVVLPLKGYDIGNYSALIIVDIVEADENGFPTETVLARGTMPSPYLYGGLEYPYGKPETFDLDRSPVLEAYKSYCIVLSGTDNYSYKARWYQQNNDFYLDGERMIEKDGLWTQYDIDFGFTLYGYESTSSPSWSFAVITDLHIGENFGRCELSENCTDEECDRIDYGEVGWSDNESSGQETRCFNKFFHPIYQECMLSYDEYPMVKYLRAIVDQINSSVQEHNIQFVVVDGDITDSAERSEFGKAKEILDTLDVPWIPVMGNHDVWPYNWEELAGCDKLFWFCGPVLYCYGNYSEAPEDIFDKYPNDWFFAPKYNDLSQNLQDGCNWYRENATPVFDNDSQHWSYFQNFYFDYGGYHFIGLDFNSRDRAEAATLLNKSVPGNSGGGELYDFEGGTLGWLRDHLDDYVNQNPDKKIILLAHHPFIFWNLHAGFTPLEVRILQNLLHEYRDNVIAEFSGHHHRNCVTKWWFFPQLSHTPFPFVETAANKDQPQARIVTLGVNNSIDFDTILPADAMSIRINRWEYPDFDEYLNIDVIDPEGLNINISENTIPGAIYERNDLYGYDQVWIPERKAGVYQIDVVPEAGANLSDTFTLTVSPMEHSFGYSPIVLAENVSIENIPSEPYQYQYTLRTTTNLTYNGNLSGYYGDAVNLSATLTDNSSNPISGKTVNFWIGSQSASAVTDSYGIANASITLNQTPSEYYQFAATFDGDIDYLPSYESTLFEILSPYDKDWSCWKQGIVAASETCGDLTSYQMELTLHYGPGSSSGSDVYLANNASSDFIDIRFLDEDRLTLLDYWVQDYTAYDKATVWVEFNNISTMGTFFYIYYGNPNASSASNGFDTFIIFNDGTSTDGWSLHPGGAYYNWAPVDGAIRCTSSSAAWSNLYCNTATGTNYYVAESKIRAQDSGVSSNYQQGIGYNTNNPMARWLETYNKWGLRDPSGESYSSVLNESEFNVSLWHDYRFVRNGNTWELFIDGESKVTRNAVSASQYTGMYAFFGAANHWAEFDDFRVRSYCDPIPSFGTWVEVYPTPTPTASPSPIPTESPTPTISPTGTPTPSPTATATPSLNGLDWSQHQKGSVTANSTCGDLSTYQMELTLHYGPGSSSGSDVYLNNSANSDFSDIRFTDFDGESLLDYWVQKYPENDVATVWVEFDAISTSGTDFYIYYGNPNASLASNGSKTFIIFNDGESTDGWSLHPSGASYNWSPMDGAIRCTSSSGAWSNLYCDTTTGTNYYVAESKIRAQDSGISSNYQQGIGYSTNNPMARWLETYNKWGLRDPSGESYSSVLNESEFNATLWHDYRFVRNGGAWELFIDGESKVTRNADSASQYTGMYAFFGAANHWAEFDDFRVRKHCDPEPTFGDWE